MNPERWTRIDSIFHEVRERPPADRAAFLKTACREDANLRREIESLLAEAEKTDESFQEQFSAAASDALKAGGRRFSPGQEIGHYEVLSLLGVGGFGEVYKVSDQQLKRIVALKVLPLAVASDAAHLVLFQREAEVLASLSHPNIAVVHGIEYSGGAPSIVLEYLEGETLADRIAKGAHRRGTRYSAANRGSS